MGSTVKCNFQLTKIGKTRILATYRLVRDKI